MRSALYLFYGAPVILNGERFYPEFAVEWVKSAERANVGWFSAYLQYNLPALGYRFRVRAAGSDWGKQCGIFPACSPPKAVFVRDVLKILSNKENNKMNNAINARLSKLIYAPIREESEFLAKADAFERLLFLVRRIYQILDGRGDVYQVSLRIRCAKRCGLVRLDAAADEDAGALRVQRWRIYSGIAWRVSDAGNDVSVAVEAVSGGPGVESCLDEVKDLIARFGLNGHVPPLSEVKVASSVSPSAVSPSVSVSPAKEDDGNVAVEKIGKAAGNDYSGRLVWVIAKGEVEPYPVAQAAAAMKVSRMQFVYRRNA